MHLLPTLENVVYIRRLGFNILNMRNWRSPMPTEKGIQRPTRKTSPMTARSPDAFELLAEYTKFTYLVRRSEEHGPALSRRMNVALRTLRLDVLRLRFAKTL